jgi:hypothetical protein
VPSNRRITGKYEHLLFIAAYVLAVALGELATASSTGDWHFPRNGFDAATQLYVKFSSEICTFTNVFVGDGAIRVAADCTVPKSPKIGNDYRGWRSSNR